MDIPRPQHRNLRVARCLIAAEATVLAGSAIYAGTASVMQLSKPLACPPQQWCLDFRGLGLAMAMLTTPVVLVLAASVWWLRRRSRIRFGLALLPQLAFLIPFAYGLLELAIGEARGVGVQVEVGLGVVPLSTTVFLIAAWREYFGSPDAAPERRQ